MTSLLQFGGQTDRERGVGLLFYLERTGDNGRREDAEPEACAACGEMHPKLYRAWRKPRGLLGPWVVFRYLGRDHVPDLSIPIGVERLPRGAEALSASAAATYWHTP